MRTCVGNVVVEVLMSALAHGHVVLALALKELGGVDAADKEDLVHGDLQEFAEDAADVSVRPRAEGRGDTHVGQRERQTACVPQQAASRQRLSSTRTGAEAAPHCPPGPRRQPGVLHRSLLLRLTSALARACLPSPLRPARCASLRQGSEASAPPLRNFGQRSPRPRKTLGGLLIDKKSSL